MCKISVIVPVYNAEDTLETALSSVFMQTHHRYRNSLHQRRLHRPFRRRSNERPAQRRPRAVPYAGKRRRRHSAQ